MASRAAIAAAYRSSWSPDRVNCSLAPGIEAYLLMPGFEDDVKNLLGSLSNPAAFLEHRLAQGPPLVSFYIL